MNGNQSLEFIRTLVNDALQRDDKDVFIFIGGGGVSVTIKPAFIVDIEEEDDDCE